MATFGDMQSYVSRRLLDPLNTAVSSPDVASAINDAIAYWKFRKFWFNEVRNNGSLTLTPQDGTVPGFTDFLVPSENDDGLFLMYSSQRYPLSKVSQEFYDSFYMDNGFGIPRFYTRTGNLGFQVYPLPDRAYQIGANYLKEYAPLVNSEDTNDFTTYADRLINLWALRNLQAELRQDSNMMTYYENSAMGEYKNLQVMTRKSNATGRLSIDSTLMGVC